MKFELALFGRTNADRARLLQILRRVVVATAADVRRKVPVLALPVHHPRAAGRLGRPGAQRVGDHGHHRPVVRGRGRLPALRRPGGARVLSRLEREAHPRHRARPVRLHARKLHAPALVARGLHRLPGERDHPARRRDRREALLALHRRRLAALREPPRPQRDAAGRAVVRGLDQALQAGRKPRQPHRQLLREGTVGGHGAGSAAAAAHQRAARAAGALRASVDQLRPPRPPHHRGRRAQRRRAGGARAHGRLLPTLHPRHRRAAAAGAAAHRGPDRRRASRVGARSRQARRRSRPREGTAASRLDRDRAPPGAAAGAQRRPRFAGVARGDHLRRRHRRRRRPPGRARDVRASASPIAARASAAGSPTFAAIRSKRRR